MQAWEQFLQLQEEELGKETVQKWLKSLKILRFDACNIYLEAKDSFQVLWFEEHIRSKALLKLTNGNNKKIKVHLSIVNAPLNPKKLKVNKKGEPKTSSHQFQLTFDELNPLCHFENFVAVEENRLSHHLLSEIAGLNANKNDKTTQLGTFNPIYIYGCSGSGKTHLLMSLAQAFQLLGLKPIYARAETFTNHLVTAIRAGEMRSFRQAYRNIDVLLIDDIHLFSRKGATQEEFFHTFNSLHLEGKQIILSAKCSPQELQLIEPRLISRFEWGIVLPIKCLKADDMRLILTAKAQAFQFPLPPKISEFLIETFKSSPKALAKALEALILRLHLDSSHSIHGLSISAAKTILADLMIEEQQSILTPTKIVQVVADYYGIHPDDIRGKAQSRDCALPRQLSIYLCRQELKIPFKKIGDFFNRDHSTVMTSVRQIQKAIDEDNRDIITVYQLLLKKLQA